MRKLRAWYLRHSDGDTLFHTVVIMPVMIATASWIMIAAMMLPVVLWRFICHA